LKVLCDRGYLGRVDFDCGRAGRQVGYFLRDLGRSAYPDLSRALPETRRAPTDDDGRRAWTRGEFWAAAVRQKVGCDQSPRARQLARELWGAEVPPAGPLPYDIVYAEEPKIALLLVVDDRRMHPPEIVEGLPLHVSGGPKVKTIVRPADDGSAWDPASKSWREGPRLALLRRLLEATPQFEPWSPRPFREVGLLRQVDD
jgi:hypothetical protein